MVEKIFNSIKVLINENDLIKTKVVYKLTFPDGQCYVGKTTQKLKNRLQEHCSRALNKCKSYNTNKYFAIRENKSFTVDILYEGEDINNKEKEYIKYYESFTKGHNCTIGGDSNFYYSDNIKIKISENSKGKSLGKSRKKRQIFQLSLSGEVIKEWDSIVNAGKELGLESNTIGKCCRGVRKTYGGFMWIYKN